MNTRWRVDWEGFEAASALMVMFAGIAPVGALVLVPVVLFFALEGWLTRT